MGARITRQHAEKIRRKLKAKPSGTPSKHHKLYDVIEDGRLIATIGISHTKKPEFPHDHIPGQLHVNASLVRSIADCNMDRDEWLVCMRLQGLA